MDGGPGDDELFPWLGDEVIRGGAGNDELNYSFAHRRLNIDIGAGRAVGMGTDRFSQIETVHGGQENDRIEGSNGGDRIFGAAGHDKVFGRGGNDALIGDCIHSTCPRGQDGDDELTGGPGNDNFNGGGGSDLCVQNTGRETIGHISCEVYRG